VLESSTEDNMAKTKAYTVAFPPDLREALQAQVDGYNASLHPGQPLQSFHGEVISRLYQSLNPDTKPVVGGSRYIAHPSKKKHTKKLRAVRGPQQKLAGVS
jgi:hypothetical protein